MKIRLLWYPVNIIKQEESNDFLTTNTCATIFEMMLSLLTLITIYFSDSPITQIYNITGGVFQEGVEIGTRTGRKRFLCKKPKKNENRAVFYTLVGGGFP